MTENNGEIKTALEEVTSDLARLEADMKKLNDAFAETMAALSDVFAQCKRHPHL